MGQDRRACCEDCHREPSPAERSYDSPPRLHDAEADGWEAEYDPVKHRQEMARKQIGESRTPDSLAWR
jgi:hypothetical protein